MGTGRLSSALTDIVAAVYVIQLVEYTGDLWTLAFGFMLLAAGILDVIAWLLDHCPKAWKT